MTRALIFDMDGVIVDSEPLHLQAYQTVLRDYNVNYSEEDNREFLGRKLYECASVLVARYRLNLTPAELLERKETVLSDLFRRHASLKPGIEAALLTAAKLELPTGIASSSTSALIALVLETLGVRDYFQAVTSGQEVKNGKPAPDIFLLAGQRLGAKPKNCLVIEDSINGIRAAKSAGMQCVAVPCPATRYQDHAEADLRLESLAELDLEKWVQTGNLLARFANL